MYMECERRWILLYAFSIFLNPFLSLHNDGGLIGKPALGKVYKTHLTQRRQLRSHGHLVSHFPLGTKPKAISNTELLEIFFISSANPEGGKTYFAIEMTIFASFNILWCQ